MISPRAARRYAPFVLLAAVQALLVAIAPSTGTTVSSVGAAPPPVIVDRATGSTLPDAVDFDPSAVDGGRPGAPVPGPSGPGAGTRPVTAATVPGGAPTPTAPTTTVAGAPANGIDPSQPAAWPWSSPWTLDGDRTTCGEGGLLQDTLLAVSPPCVPDFTADNGGATWPGVTGDKVTIVVYRKAGNAAVDAILAQQNLGATEEEDAEATAAYAEYFNRTYEFYGRQIDWIVHQGRCDGTVPSCMREDAREVVTRYDPFYVVWDDSAFPAFHDELAKLGVLNAGGWHITPRFREERRPFTWDLYPDGITASKHVARYWCNRMVGKQASLAGDPQLQVLDRKLGIITQQFPEYRENADALKAMVTGGICTSPSTPVIATYNYDIGRAQEQMTALVQILEEEGVTTVVCLCDPIMPVFMTQAADQQSYFPEWLLSGLPALSHDFLGRLYTPSQMAQWFGPSMRPQEAPMDDADHQRAWEAVGRSGRPAYLTLNRFMWMRFIAMQVQWAGPNLTPLTVERGTLESPQIGGFDNPSPWPGWECCQPDIEMMQFGPGDYTAHEDAKHVRWSASAASPIDGRPGAYVCIEDGCPRRRAEQWEPGEPRQ